MGIAIHSDIPFRPVLTWLHRENGSPLSRDCEKVKIRSLQQEACARVSGVSVYISQVVGQPGKAHVHVARAFQPDLCASGDWTFSTSAAAGGAPFWSAAASDSATPLWIAGSGQAPRSAALEWVVKAPSPLRSAGALQMSSGTPKDSFIFGHRPCPGRSGWKAQKGRFVEPPRTRTLRAF